MPASGPSGSLPGVELVLPVVVAVVAMGTAVGGTRTAGTSDTANVEDGTVTGSGFGPVAAVVAPIALSLFARPSKAGPVPAVYYAP